MGTSVIFQSKHPHNTLWLSLEHPVGEAPVDLIEDLENIGWSISETWNLPPLDGIQEVVIQGPKGSGLFASWTPEEKRKFMPRCRRVLKQHGFEGVVPHHKLDIQDLL